MSDHAGSHINLPWSTWQAAQHLDMAASATTANNPIKFDLHLSKLKNLQLFSLFEQLF